MTLSSTVNRVSYAGNGSTTAFAFSYLFYADGDLTVILVNDSTGVETTKTITTHYTVSGAGSGSGGTVTMVTAPATGETLVIIREVDLTQGLDLVENDPFPSELVEQQFDQSVMMAQQINTAVARSMKLSDGDTTGVDTTLPTPVALKTFRWNAGLTALEQTDDPAVSATAAAASAAAALVSENAAAADLVLTNADVVSTNADVVSTNADVITTAAAVVQAQAAAYGWATVTDITAATTNLEVTDARKYYILDATSNTIDINLPAIGSDEGVLFAFEVKNVDNAITIVRDGTDYINGVNGNYSGLTAVGDIIYVTSDDNSPDNWLVVFVSRGMTASSTNTLTNKTFDANGTGNSLSNVDVADLANGTDGELITWDATGAPATVAAGTAAQVLTSNGAGAAPTFQTPAAGGAWNLIGTAVASTDATLTITGLDSTYDTYAIVISDMVPSTTTGVSFHINVGDSGGVDTGASDYAYHQSSFDTAAATYYAFNSTGDSKLSITGGNSIGGTAGKGIGGVLFLHRPGDGTTFPSLSGQGFFSAYTAKLYGWSLYGQRVAVITLDRVQVSFSGGNISTGRLSVFGISHA